jgi:hypothetical protein
LLLSSGAAPSCSIRPTITGYGPWWCGAHRSNT